MAERDSVCGFTPQVATMSWGWARLKQKPGTLSRTPVWVRVPKSLGLLLCFPRLVSSQLDHEWNNLGIWGGGGLSCGIVDEAAACSTSIPFGWWFESQHLHFRSSSAVARPSSRRVPKSLVPCNCLGILEEAAGSWLQICLAHICSC